MSWGSQPNRMFLIAENTNGYWDAPYRYHHCKGYFLKTGNNQWKEYKNNKLFAKFQTVDDDDEYNSTTSEYDNSSNENCPIYRPMNGSKNRVETVPCDVGADQYIYS
ncbi:unnamed protein product [Rotaria socialis]|nr:unnamed protein product [Rotaria socialis]